MSTRRALVLLLAASGCREIAGIDEYTFPYEACVPGSAPRACYPGPAETEGVGTCVAGTETCNAEGSAYEACTAVTPLTYDPCAIAGEVSATLDTNCDGQVTACTHAVEWLRFFEQGDPAPHGVAVAEDLSPYVAGYYTTGATVAGLPVPDMGVPGTPGVPESAALLLSLRPGGELRGVHGELAAQAASRTLVDAASLGADVFAAGLDGPDPDDEAPAARLFLQKFDAATGAPTLTVTRVGEGGATHRSPRIAARSEGSATEVWLASSFTGDADLDGVDVGAPPLTSAGAEDVLLAKLGPDGAVAWSKAFGDGSAQHVRSLATATQGGAWIAGYLDGGLAFGGACAPIATAPNRRYFAASFDGDGNCVLAARVATAVNNQPSEISVDVLEPPGQEPIGIVVYVPGTGGGVATASPALRLTECASAGCTDTDLFTVTAGAASASLRLAGAELAGSGELVVAVEYQGLLQVVTSEETFSSDRTAGDAAILKLRREGPAQWRVLWAESLARGQDAAQVTDLRDMAVAPSGETILVGRGRGPLGAVPGPDAIPTTDTLFVARIGR